MGYNAHNLLNVSQHSVATCLPLSSVKEKVKQEISIKQALLATSLMPISCLTYSLNLMEATCYSKVLAGFQWTN
jgi:hypothetical protein